MRVGVLGGVFNPPHIGHLICSQEAIARLGLDRVLMVPVGEAPHRGIDQDPGGEARLDLCRLAARDDERVEVSRIELDRAGPSYTADTLAELRERDPGTELVLLLGGDEAAALATWHEPERVLGLATVAAVERQGRRRDDIAERLVGLRGGDRVEFFDMPRLDVSSSMIRRRVAEGLPIRYLVPDAVAEAVEAHGHYASSRATVVAE